MQTEIWVKFWMHLLKYYFKDTQLPDDTVLKFRSYNPKYHLDKNTSPRCALDAEEEVFLSDYRLFFWKVTRDCPEKFLDKPTTLHNRTPLN